MIIQKTALVLHAISASELSLFPGASCLSAGSHCLSVLCLPAEAPLPSTHLGALPPGSPVHLGTLPPGRSLKASWAVSLC